MLSGTVRGGNPGWPKPLLAMIEAPHSRSAMQQFHEYAPDERAWDIFVKMSRGMLSAVRPEGSSCVIMSALLAISLEEPLDTLVPVVAGALKLDGDYVYGSNRAFDGRRVFSQHSADWDGHRWLLFGNCIIDISLGRTARHGHCRPQLTRRVLSIFGQNVGMMTMPEERARQAGLRYLPRYVLTSEQVLADAAGAINCLGVGQV